MSEPAESGVMLAGTPLAAVAELDRDEREAISSGDWARLGHVLDRQKELWQRLLQSAGHDGVRAREAAAALAYLHAVRRRNHELIATETDNCRRLLAAADCL